MTTTDPEVQKMKRTVLLGVGTAAVLALTGSAIGVAAAGVTDDRPRAAAVTAAVGADQAARIALDRVGSGQVVEVRADTANGRPTWNVEIVSGGVKHEVDVDRETAAIVKAQSEQAQRDAAASADDPANHDATDDKGGQRAGGASGGSGGSGPGGADDPASHATDDHGGSGHRRGH
jgi:uncharacterized membrane protein YkoI